MKNPQFILNENPRKLREKRARAWALILLLALALAAVLVAPARAQPASDRFGLGLVLGSPSGLSLKIPQGAQSVNVIVGYDFDDGPPPPRDRGWGDDWLYVGADYVWYNYGLIRVERGRLPLYYGPGVYAAISEPRSAVGIRFAVGLEYQFAQAPFDIFLELGPRINVVPNTDGDIFVGLGGRFFF